MRPRTRDLPWLGLAILLSIGRTRKAAAFDAPMNYLSGYGARADPVVPLTWGVLLVSVVVIAITSALVLAAILRPRGTQSIDQRSGKPALAATGGGMSWITIGVGVSTLVLLITVIWTMRVLAVVGPPPGEPKLTVELTAHQWWWQVRYLSDRPAEIFTTANEVHIPVGSAVRFRLISPDVIHSFWVPSLSGQMDMIPGQTNLTWLEADKPGSYRGQCVEYCGVQHANMALWVMAEPADQFRAWRQQQTEPLSEAAKAQTAGRVLFETRCGACHTVRGTSAGGILGPDLTHLMSRSTLAAGSFPNTPGHLAGWLVNPQVLKPGNHMPDIELTPAELHELTNFLQALS